MPRLRSLLAFVCLALCASLARAHSPLESSLSVFKTDEGFELMAELTLPSAARLLPPEAAQTFSAATFPAHRDALKSAASQVFNLLDPEGRPLASTRTFVSLNHHGDVRITRLYAADAPAASVRFDLLAALPPGQFCTLTDHRTQPASQHILQKDKPAYLLAPPTSPAPSP